MTFGFIPFLFDLVTGEGELRPGLVNQQQQLPVNVVKDALYILSFGRVADFLPSHLGSLQLLSLVFLPTTK